MKEKNKRARDEWGGRVFKASFSPGPAPPRLPLPDRAERQHLWQGPPPLVFSPSASFSLAFPSDS